MKHLLIISMTLLFGQIGFSSTSDGVYLPYPQFQTTDVPVGEVNISKKLSDDENVVLHAKVVYPNGCYTTLYQFDRLGHNGNKIYIENNALVRDGMCTKALVYTKVFFDLSEYEPGVYKVYDAANSSYIGELIIDDDGTHKIYEFAEL